MYSDDELQKIEIQRKEWEENTLNPAFKKYWLDKSPVEFYTPADTKKHDFLKKVGFPGEYPFTAGSYAFTRAAIAKPMMSKGADALAVISKSGMYSGYGCAEDYSDYYKEALARGLQRAGTGPNIAFDLPTQIGYDSDNPLVKGEVGKVGVAVDCLRDFEVIYQTFTEGSDLDKIASNFTINAPANIIVAMYIALADRRGISPRKLRSTPQNDILKEFVARGTYIFPPQPSVKRMFRDSLVFLSQNCPGIEIASIGGLHIREAGATREQDLSFSMAIGIEYLQTGIDAGLDIDSFAPQIGFNGFGGSMEFFKEIALQRAARRMWATILKEKFGAKNPKSMMIRQLSGALIGCSSTTAQRPLNNLSRTVMGAVACALSGGPPVVYPPYDEPLGLGWSAEAQQLTRDALLILLLEAGLSEVADPLAGSYYMESLTDQIEEAAWKEMAKIEAMGGAIAAIESGYMHKEVAKSAYERQSKIERGETLIVGVNCAIGENELEVIPPRIVSYPYDPARREQAEDKQIASLKEVKRTRDNREVARLLQELEQAAKKEDENLIPHFIECAKAYVTEQEMCDVLRGIFGEYQSTAL